MNRLALTGLFAFVAAIATPAFASNEGDQCRMNLQNVRDAQITVQGISDQVKGDIATTIHRAEAAQARNTSDGDRECISLTSQAMQKIQSH